MTFRPVKDMTLAEAKLAFPSIKEGAILRAQELQRRNKESDLMEAIKDVLKVRGEKYGKFSGHASTTQKLKLIIADELDQRKKHIAPFQREALDMIMHKIGRIINGDPNYIDSWVDIAGYAQLVADQLEEDEKFNAK